MTEQLGCGRGSRALDALTRGGYPAGSIIEVCVVPLPFRMLPRLLQIHGPSVEPCWQLAWLAAAAAYKRGWNVVACSGHACLDFGAPAVLLDVLRSLEAECSLVLVDSWTRIVDAAAPADSATTWALRNRRLATFLRQLSGRLLMLQAQRRGNPVNGGTSSNSGGGESRDKTQRWPAPSVLVCNSDKASAALVIRGNGGRGRHGRVLQQYAAMRLRVSEDLDDIAVEGGPDFMTVELLKGPAVNTRMPTTQTRVYTSSRTTDGLPITEGHAFPTVMDLLMAAQQLGLIARQDHTESSPLTGNAGYTAGEDAYVTGSDRPPGAVAEFVKRFSYGDFRADTLGSLASQITANGHMTQLREQVVQKLHPLP
ncbi:hypothetical protein VOLCADRAFT_94861 [Volvox carteri f. nagariensis]|uniref:Uncharacterized protein n=1 Tax=Volvox carteri f. nagariensis TaxID=3068 RepID=D8U5Z1_VOLCA|nr:uncharacterized protein VOLCADRAFT_94861 [Volvox carteri f. nagariensis]EFJ44844.1 hypothetical protein VOLCADRAFT_94861 [Volvox carteri f. nagariensis]|eukprot:XP_002954127.1 hypothetical protein VOLCADRAFT_94861 [Volvox carteri f. nagariensis]